MGAELQVSISGPLTLFEQNTALKNSDCQIDQGLTYDNNFLGTVLVSMLRETTTVGKGQNQQVHG